MAIMTNEQRNALCETYERLFELKERARDSGASVIHSVGITDDDLCLSIILCDRKDMSVDYYKHSGYILNGEGVKMMEDANRVLDRLTGELERERLIKEYQKKIEALKAQA